MKFLVVTFGISGSGKSEVCKDYEKEGFIRVCPDEKRKELTGSMSDLSRDNEVFPACFSDTYKALMENKNVIFDSTGLDYVTRKKLQRIALKAKATPSLLVIMDSFDLELCKERVTNDIANGVERSNVPMNVIEKQHQKFIDSFEFIYEELWDGVIEYDN